MLLMKKKTYEDLKNKLFTRFYFRNFDKEMHKLFINNLDDCIQHIQDNENTDNITFITNTDLTHILFQIIDDKYIPYTQFHYSVLSRLSFKLKNEEDDEKAIIYTIAYTDSSMVENEIMPIEPIDISNYDKADRHIYEWLN